MQAKFNADNIGMKLRKLPDWGKRAFMLSCCERMLPLYAMFELQSTWGNSKILRTAIDAGWSQVASNGDSQDLISLAVKCEEIAPDTEGSYDSTLVSEALNAAVAVSDAMEVLHAFDQERIVGIARSEIDCPELYVQFLDNIYPNDKLLNEKILLHPLMQLHLRLQEGILAVIEGSQESTRHALPAVRASTNKQAEEVRETWSIFVKG